MPFTVPRIVPRFEASPFTTGGMWVTVSSSQGAGVPGHGQTGMFGALEEARGE